MIKIDRGPDPKWFSSDRAVKLRADAETFFAVGASARRQQTHAFEVKTMFAATGADLIRVFHEKCAYCETPLTSGAALEHFRPKLRARQPDGRESADHYWWLAYEWSNVLLACQACNSAKASRFPVEGRRASRSGGARSVRAEKALLLDPCRDAPEQHLVFSEDGRVAARGVRGETTIDVLQLNREHLVAARAERAALVQRVLDIAESTRGDSGGMQKAAHMLRPLILADAAYAQLARQLLADWVSQEGNALGPKLLAALDHVDGDELRALLGNTSLTPAQRQRAIQRYGVGVARREHHAPGEIAGAQLIRKIVIHNFKSIADLEIDLTKGSADGRPSRWLMLLGENGVGKTTILQALALALMGPERSALKIDAAGCVRRGASTGFVEVHLTNRVQPVRLELSTRRGVFRSKRDASLRVVGYGATRILERGGRRARAGATQARVQNLFDPFEPIGDMGRMLLSVKPIEFDDVARAVKKMLPLEANAVLERTKGRLPSVMLHAAGASRPLSELSDGYQSIIGLTIDIARHFRRLRRISPETAEGLVFIDEVETHLHPRWKMAVVSGLRAAFPLVQFITTTHDPLCLRGLRTEDVAVLRADQRGRVHVVDELPPLEGMRVDQILQSEPFGLSSTMAPRVERAFDEMYQLLSFRKLGKKDQAKLDELRRELAPYDVLGQTRRERMMLEAIDRFIASERSGAASRARDEQSLQDRLQAILAGGQP